jgi:adenine-specific DNA-methyltransferase
LGIRYIGSKARVAEAIVDLAGVTGNGRFVDAFCGTGSVAATASNRGWPVVINDVMPSAVAMATGALVGKADVPFTTLGGYASACDALNALEGRQGFLHREYSPASMTHAGVARMYFSEENAARLDAMRLQVSSWVTRGALSKNEEQLLLADLMQAANRVANISGTYGSFLSSWTSNALRPLTMRPRILPPRETQFISKVGDAFSVETEAEDVVYYDPPYTKRQYAAYYHLLETLTAGDSPHVAGVTGLRPWRDKASEFSYKSRALDALKRLVLGTTCRKMLLSYSNEGHVDRDLLVSALEEAGNVTLHRLKPIGRYRPNAAASAAGNTVEEYVIEIEPVIAPSRQNNRSLGQIVSA